MRTANELLVVLAQVPEVRVVDRDLLHAQFASENHALVSTAGDGAPSDLAFSRVEHVRVRERERRPDAVRRELRDMSSQAAIRSGFWKTYANPFLPTVCEAVVAR